MSAEGVNNSRRRFLTAATTVVGAVGTGFVAVPFIKSWSPSARARAAGAPVEADISKLEAGQMIAVEWRGKPVFVAKRTEENLKLLATNPDFIADPNSEASDQPAYCQNPARAREEHPEISVLVGVCTHLGCAPEFLPEVTPARAAALGDDWEGGYFCPCHGSKYDLSGRVYKSVPAPLNLPIPPYSFISDTVILIGEDGEAA